MNKHFYRVVNLLKFTTNLLIALLKYPPIINQLINPKTIPIIIVNYNQLYFFEQLISFLLARNFKNIVVIDNASDYKPLLDYYLKIENKVQVLRRSINSGHMVFFKENSYLKKFGRGFYVLTDPDILPNEKLPSNFMRRMINMTALYYSEVNKVGFALKIDNLPSSYDNKEKVKSWETKFWKKQVAKDIYMAHIDTTFAIYRPRFRPNPKSNFFAAIRMAGNYAAEHGGWYIDSKNLTEEQQHYIKTANKSASWKLNDEGKFTSNYYGK